MQATIRIPLIALATTGLSYGLAAIATSTGWIQAAAALLPAAVTSYVLLLRESARRDAVEAELRAIATHDPLTGLVTRAVFQETLDRALARSERRGQRFGVAYIDLNDFKQVNDSHGHHVGDMLLAAVARRIATVVRAGDCAARFGGDEFVVLVDDREEYGVHKLAERLRDLFSAPFDIEGTAMAATASIGVAIYPNHGSAGLNLINAADKAMYSAKHSRKGKPVTATASAA